MNEVKLSDWLRKEKEKKKRMKKSVFLMLFHLLILVCCSGLSHEKAIEEGRNSTTRTVIDVEGGPDSVVWVVQLSDLHFSIHHPQRALDFRNFLGPALSIIRPSLVLITGDLTDGKSKDLLIMKQHEEEWLEYQQVIEDVIRTSGLDLKTFYDLRGNHDSFGVPDIGSKFAFYHKYSINAQLGRSGNVQSVTLRESRWKHLFVGLDTAMEVGLRGPTNLFGHPTEQLLSDLDQELSQWDAKQSKVTKIAFGHFPLSFSAATESGQVLKDVFLKHSLSAYICGHLHTKFGKNLKRHYTLGHHLASDYFQLDMFQGNNIGTKNCLNKSVLAKEFWEWEMGDWRKSRIMRILAIDAGHVSFVDFDFTLGDANSIILPTFPLDSRFMQRSSSLNEYNCQTTSISSYETLRALVFSEYEIVSVLVRIFDSKMGNLDLVYESVMKKREESPRRGDLYAAQWNWRAFSDPSPDRFWLQVEATDILGRSSFSQLRPFSINGLTAKVNWKWKEFLVMGCQWEALYRPILQSVLVVLFSMLLIPKAFLIYSKNFTYRNHNVVVNVKGIRKYLIGGIFWVLLELSRSTSIWFGLLSYLMCLTFFPWFFGQVFTESGSFGYMSHKGWTIRVANDSIEQSYLGVPDVIVVVIPHLYFVVLPAVIVSAAMVAEKTVYNMHYLSQSGKKKDDLQNESERHVRERWIRKLLLVVCFVIFWKHWKHCRALTTAYDMNPVLHSPIYCFLIPLLLAYAVFKTRGMQVQ